ncbi:MarR family winged helix-turn-helix transcriptional regulator [Halobacteriovorax sp. GFR7]|uniref:MarR family winged helix-turn-helix transcriptional regulator n=1 Tax=unclassified Halobacteriovorax TaxID=2639665 RepID=UPI003D9534AE
MGIIRSYIKRESESEISFPKYRILARVNDGVCTCSDLADVIHVSCAAISKLVDTLVNDKYISREACKTDRRITFLKITAKGKKKFEKVRSGASHRFSGSLENLSASEVSQLTSALEVIENFVLKLQEGQS